MKRFAVAVYDNGDLFLEIISANTPRKALMDTSFIQGMLDDDDDEQTMENLLGAVPNDLEAIKRYVWHELEWEVAIEEIL